MGSSSYIFLLSWAPLLNDILLNALRQDLLSFPLPYLKALLRA